MIGLVGEPNRLTCLRGCGRLKRIGKARRGRGLPSKGNESLGADGRRVRYLRIRPEVQRSGRGKQFQRTSGGFGRRLQTASSCFEPGCCRPRAGKLGARRLFFRDLELRKYTRRGGRMRSSWQVRQAGLSRRRRMGHHLFRWYGRRLRERRPCRPRHQRGASRIDVSWDLRWNGGTGRGYLCGRGGR